MGELKENQRYWEVIQFNNNKLIRFNTTQHKIAPNNTLFN